MKFILPDQYKHKLFYPNLDEVEIVEDSRFEPFFAADLIALTNDQKPWEELEHWSGLIQNEWKALSDEMRPLFEGRADQTYEGMVKGLSLFFTLLYWANEQHVSVATWEEDVVKFEVAIMNPVERITFILKRPAVYFSFIQLDEMFRELIKTSAKFDAIKKRKRG